MLASFLTILGLVLTAIGTGIAAWSVRITQKDAIRIAGKSSDINESLRDNLLKQSRSAMWGLVLVAVGTVIQIIVLLW
jgi:uncharacterized protein YjeT (DUF2065 family)